VRTHSDEDTLVLEIDVGDGELAGERHDCECVLIVGRSVVCFCR
jgi:hypothetical protein